MIIRTINPEQVFKINSFVLQNGAILNSSYINKIDFDDKGLSIDFFFTNF